ncbi:MAG: pilus assembly protein TadG-related protein, partial [Lacipirellulaceae bacterium]
MNTGKPSFLRTSRGQRKGAITVLAALMTVCMLAMVAFTVDVGYILSSEQELQRTADSAALAACWEYAKNRAHDNNQYDSINAGRLVAAQYAGLNRIGGAATQIDPNLSNSTSGDITYGRIDDLYTADPT